MTDQHRALHALNRLTFGPRPGDVDRVLAQPDAEAEMRGGPKAWGRLPDPFPAWREAA